MSDRVQERIAADAFVAALAQWPSEGVPQSPGAWLMTAAKRRLIDRVRRDKTLAEKTEQLQKQHPYDGVEPDFAATFEEIDDDMLRLMFVTCHPVLSPEARVALDVPEGHERLQRLPPVLEAVYLIFNEGYAATAGDDVLRPELVEDALRLGRMLARLMPHEADVHGLIALMEIQASRIPARLASDGSPILLLDQDRGKWNHLLIQRGLAALARAERLGPLGPYTLQASIAACHARAVTPDATDWQRIAALYDALAAITPSPVVELNRSVAVGMAYGPEAALAIVDALLDEPSLGAYHLLPSVRGDLLFKIGRFDEARLEFERAHALAGNARDRALLQKRVDECRSG